jgi:hypothetical protein
MLDHNAIRFPDAGIIPSFAKAFLRMMFAHAEFEEQVRELHETIIKTPAKRLQPVCCVFFRISAGKPTAALELRAHVQNA